MGLIFTIRLYNNEVASYSGFNPNFTEKYNLFTLILAWQIPFFLEAFFGGSFLFGIVIALGSILLFIWIAYIIDKKIFSK